MARARGLSLAETVLALFLLTAGCLMMVQLFHQATRADRRTQQLQNAITLGEKTLARVRSWASQPNNFDSNWAPWNTTLTDPDFPGLEVEVTALPSGRALASPASRLELPYGAKGRRLARLVVPVKVRVRWGSENLTLFTYCAAPAHPMAANAQVELSNLPAAPLSANQVAQVNAQLRDGAGQPLTGVTFNWSLIPVTGNGSLRPDLQDRSGQAMSLQNMCYLPTGQQAILSGEAAVAVQARYRGRIYSNFLPNTLPSERIQLNP
ncbi:MAG: hypothetical protein J0I12_06195 [Candidatus Eremiobacteraeota bacterium]|nr:hypothetical protein [Candidatus Eremiobacteraeota bacterium]